MAVDFARSCSVFMAPIVQGSDTLYPVRSYFCAPGAQALPFASAFGLPFWFDEPDEFVGPGIPWRGAKWRSCTLRSTPPGTHYHGPEAWYQTGVQRLATPPYQICNGTVIVPAGGLQLSGTSPLAAVCVLAAGDGLGSPVTAVSVQTVTDMIGCGCGVADTTVYVNAYLSESCGCGSPLTGVAIYPVYALTATACGCGQAEAEVQPAEAILSAGCGCGSAETVPAWAPPGPILESIVIAQITTVQGEYALDMEGCGCGLAESQIAGYLELDAEACGCGEAETVISESQTVSAAAGCGFSQTSIGAMAVACCPDNTLPLTLLATIADAGGCACLAGTYALGFVGNGTWESQTMTLCGTANAFLTLACNTTLQSFEFILTCSDNAFTGEPSTVDCATPMITFEGLAVDAPGELCGFCSGSINVTVHN